jgi:hypothetical protein
MRVHKEPTKRRLFSDTTPEAERVLIELMRDAPASQKLAMVGEMYLTVRALAMSGLKRRYPNAAQSDLRRRLADILLGPELAERVYGPSG